MNEPFALPPDCPLDEVEWRADSDPFSRGGGKSARWVPHLKFGTCARLLDEWVGPNNWRIDGYKPSSWAEGGLVCQVSVRFPGEDEWIPRQAAGDIPNGMHRVKGAETDAFKRTVGRAWGCGRNVYSLPTLWAPCDERQSKAGKSFAVMNSATVPALVEQLRAQGFDPGDRVQVADHDDAAAHAETPTQSNADEGAADAAAAGGSTPSAETSDTEPANLMEMLGSLHAQKDVITQLRNDGLWPLGTLTGEAHEKALTALKAAHTAEKLAAQS